MCVCLFYSEVSCPAYLKSKRFSDFQTVTVHSNQSNVIIIILVQAGCLGQQLFLPTEFSIFNHSDTASFVHPSGKQTIAKCSYVGASFE